MFLGFLLVSFIQSVFYLICLRWKIHESCMLAMGSVVTLIVEYVQTGKIQFDVMGFLQSVVLDDMNYSGRYMYV